MIVLEAITVALVVLISLCLGYLLLLVLASIPQRATPIPDRPTHTFAIAIPAHNEQEVIGATVDRLLRLDYPREMYHVHVVSDNSTDQTAETVRSRGVECWERFDETRRSKGYALAWLFERLLRHEKGYDAIVVFDADSQVDHAFLRVMDARLCQGQQVVQGRHVIANPADSWFTAAMFVSFALDNLRNAGRSNLGLSAKLMGDAMCFAREVLEEYQWTTVSLTEDAEYQALLLLKGVCVAFACDALSFGEMPTSLAAARRQRSRWMRGRAEMARRLAPVLLRSGLRKRSLAQLDGAIERVMPSYSTLLTLWAATALVAGGLNPVVSGFSAPWRWILGLGAAFALYPVVGLLLAGAPGPVYVYLAFAPLYVLWRTAIRLAVRMQRKPRRWVRTPRKTTNRPAEGSSTLLGSLIARALGPRPNRPLLALTTLVFPGQFMACLHASGSDRTVDWGKHQAAATLSFDVDLAEDVEAVPWLLEVLRSRPFRVGFACIGRWIEQQPDTHRRIADEGHEIINHTYSHPWSEAFNPRSFLALTREEQREEIQRGHEVIVRALGYEPVGFRAPHLDMSPAVYPILAEMSYRYSSSALARRTGFLPFRTRNGVWEFPVAQCPQHPSSAFDTYHAFRSGSWLYRIRSEDEDGFFESFVRLLRLGMTHGAHVNVYFDPMDVRRFRDFPRFLDHLLALQGRVKVVSYRELVEILESAGRKEDRA